MNGVRRVCGAVFLMLAAAPVVAHHSFSAEYDDKKPVKLTGKVTTMKWSNPHAWIYLDVVDKNGKVAKWSWETGGANALIRAGWKKADLPAGTVLVIEGFQARNGSNTANASSITFPDGKRLFAASSRAGAK